MKTVENLKCKWRICRFRWLWRRVSCHLWCVIQENLRQHQKHGLEGDRGSVDSLGRSEHQLQIELQQVAAGHADQAGSTRRHNIHQRSRSQSQNWAADNDCSSLYRRSSPCWRQTSTALHFQTRFKNSQFIIACSRAECSTTPPFPSAKSSPMESQKGQQESLNLL